MKFCIYCGASHDDTDQFCGECGRGIVDEHEYHEHQQMGTDYHSEIEYEDDDQYRVTLDVHDDDYYHGEMGYHDDDETVIQGSGVRGHQTQQGVHRGGRQQQYHPHQDGYYEDEYHFDPRSDYDDYGPLEHTGKNTKQNTGGKGLIVALCLILGLGLLAVVGYFVIYPAFFDENGYQGDIITQENDGEEDERASQEGDEDQMDESTQRVQAVIQAIDRIQSYTLTHEDRTVQEAREMYNALSSEEQALVTNIQQLEELEAIVASLVAQEEERLLAEEEREKRFEVIGRAMTWSEAYQYARSRGGYLATIVNQEEFNQIVALASATDLRVLWLGGRRGADNDFVWITGETFSFSHWLPGEPTPPDGIENYLSMMLVDGQWRWVNIPNDVSDVYQASWIGFVIAWDEE